MTMDLLLGKILVVRGMMPPSFANIHSDASILIIRSGDSAYASFQTRKIKKIFILLDKIEATVYTLNINVFN